ncbi:MAG: hypothetical protein ABJB49_02340 [Nitrospirota bacterium]
MADKCVGTALIYSGRPDPEWHISDRPVASLIRVWSELPPGASNPPRAPALGYRGCAMRCASGDKWFAYGGAVTVVRGSGPFERRSDTGRRFEKALLRTAPKGVLPKIET